MFFHIYSMDREAIYTLPHFSRYVLDTLPEMKDPPFNDISCCEHN